jgi:hypothetical protein
MANDYMAGVRKCFGNLESKYKTPIWNLFETQRRITMDALVSGKEIEPFDITEKVNDIKKQVQGEYRATAFDKASVIVNKLKARDLSIIKGSRVSADLEKPDKGIRNIDILKKYLIENTLPFKPESKEIIKRDKELYGSLCWIDDDVKYDNIVVMLAYAVMSGGKRKSLSRDKDYFPDIDETLANTFLSPALRDTCKVNNVYHPALISSYLKDTIHECLLELYPDDFKVETGKYCGIYCANHYTMFIEPIPLVRPDV